MSSGSALPTLDEFKECLDRLTQERNNMWCLMYPLPHLPSDKDDEKESLPQLPSQSDYDNCKCRPHPITPCTRQCAKRCAHAQPPPHEHLDSCPLYRTKRARLDTQMTLHPCQQSQACSCLTNFVCYKCERDNKSCHHQQPVIRHKRGCPSVSD